MGRLHAARRPPGDRVASPARRQMSTHRPRALTHDAAAIRAFVAGELQGHGGTGTTSVQRRKNVILFQNKSLCPNYY